jgi:hypothetical protein
MRCALSRYRWNRWTGERGETGGIAADAQSRDQISMNEVLLA